MSRFPKRIAVLTCMLFMAAAAAIAQGVEPPDWENIGVGLIQAVVPVLTIVFVWLARTVVPQIPRFALPIIAMLSGTVIDFLLGLATGGQFSPIIGALLGASAVWLREFFDTIGEHGGAA